MPITDVDKDQTSAKKRKPRSAPGVGDLAPLLILRSQAKQLLACSISKLKTLEELGKLTPVKLTGGSAAYVHYRYSEVEALARGDA